MLAIILYWKRTHLDTLGCTDSDAADLNRSRMVPADCNDAGSCRGYGHQLCDEDDQRCPGCSKDGCAGILAAGAGDGP